MIECNAMLLWLLSNGGKPDFFFTKIKVIINLMMINLEINYY